MRILLKDSRKFFDEINHHNHVSLRYLSNKLNLSYTNLKKQRRGELTLQKETFMKILKLSPHQKFWEDEAIEVEDNWGAIKGGSISGKKNNMKYVRSFRKIPLIKIRLNKEFCEFYGALLGDGCISKFKDWGGTERYGIYITGNKRLDSDYMRYLKELIRNEFRTYVQYYELKNQNVTLLSIRNKGFALELNRKLGVPIGLKYNKLKISNKIMRLPWNIKKYVIRGLFDTDGCIYAKKNENYRYPQIVITSKNKSFLEEIKKILKQQDYPAYTNEKDVCVRGIENVRRWFKDIGSSNSRNLLKYEYFLKHKCLPARLLN